MSAQTTSEQTGSYRSDAPSAGTLSRLRAAWPAASADRGPTSADPRPVDPEPVDPQRPEPPGLAPPTGRPRLHAVAPVTRSTAMEELYERTHADMVRFAAFLCGDAQQADDIAHEAYVQVFAAWDRIGDTERIDAYLRVTVVNTVRGRHRRRQVADRHEPMPLRLVSSAEDDALTRVGHEALLSAVAELPIRQRTCVVMRHWMRMTESDIAAELDLSVGSVRTHIRRGTKALERRLGGRS